MATGIKDKVAIVGMGCPKCGERWDAGSPELMKEAFEEALRGAVYAVASGTDPLGLFDCSGVSEGSACAIVTTPEFARAPGKTGPVTVEALHGRAGERQLSSPSGGMAHNLGGVPYQGIAAISIPVLH